MIARGLADTYNLDTGYYMRFYAPTDCDIEDNDYVRVTEAISKLEATAVKATNSSSRTVPPDGSAKGVVSARQEFGRPELLLTLKIEPAMSLRAPTGVGLARANVCGDPKGLAFGTGASVDQRRSVDLRAAQ